MEEKIRKLNIFIKIFIYLLIIGLSIEGMIFFSKKIKKESINIKTIQVKTKQNANFLENLRTIQKEKNDIEECKKKLRLILPEEVDSPTLNIIRQLNVFARQAGVSFNIVFEKKEEKKIPFNFSLAGLRENIIKFLELIKKGQFFLSIENLNWNQEEEGEAVVIGKGYVLFHKNIPSEE